MNGSATGLGTFILVILVDWLVLSGIIYWWNPDFINDDGKVNWWTTLWVVLVLVIFSAIIMAIIGWIFFSSQKQQCAPACPPKDPCQTQCDPCRPSGLGGYSS